MAAKYVVYNIRANTLVVTSKSFYICLTFYYPLDYMGLGAL